MQWYVCFAVITLFLKCCNGASITRGEISGNNFSSGSVKSALPWNNFITFMSYFGASSPSSFEEAADQQDCLQEKSDSSETVIIYDVEEQILPSKNFTNGTNIPEKHSEKHKRDTEGTRQLETSEARHKDVRPYPGYFLGRKLWYIPLWFGIYYSFYMLCLVVKSVARHRIHYPALLPADTTFERKKLRSKNRKVDSMERRISDSVKMYNDRYRQYQ